MASCSRFTKQENFLLFFEMESSASAPGMSPPTSDYKNSSLTTLRAKYAQTLYDVSSLYDEDAKDLNDSDLALAE